MDDAGLQIRTPLVLVLMWASVVILRPGDVEEKCEF